MSSLPIGWEDRGNTMSEKDMKLGGAAAKKFSVPASAYKDSSEYQTSDQVRSFYYKQLEGDVSEKSPSVATKTALPEGWEQRQKSREVQAKQHDVFAKSNSSKQQQKDNPTSSLAPDDDAQVALLKLTTFSLQSLAQTLENRPVKLPNEERAAFAVAMKRAMDALAKTA